MRQTGGSWDNIANRLWDLSMQLPVTDSTPYADLHFRIMDIIEPRPASVTIEIGLDEDEVRMVGEALAMPDEATRGA